MDSKLSLGALSTCMEAYSAYCKPLCRELGLPQTAFDILMFLHNNPEHSTAREISSLRGLKENIISINVNKLVGEGYLLRQSDASDRRKVHLRCTQKADAVVEQGLVIQEAFIREIQQGLSPQELTTLFHCLRTVADNAARILTQTN